MWEQTKRIFLDSAEHLLHEIARLLPSVLAMFLFLALSVVLAVGMRAAVRRICERLQLDRRLREWGVWRRDGQSSPTRFLAGITFWSVLVLGVFLGLSVLDTPATSAVSLRLLASAPRLFVGLAIFVIAVGVARLVERNVLIGAVNMGIRSARLVALGARWMMVLLGAAIALDNAGIGSNVVTLGFGILFGGVVLALALAIGLGAKDFVARSLQRRFPDSGAPESQKEQEDQIHHQ